MTMFKLFFLTQILAYGITEEVMDITVSSGAFFDEVPDAVMYDKSIPLIYTQEIKNDEGTIYNVWQIEKYCLDKGSNYCKITQQILTLLKNVNENIQENFFDMSEIGY